jgi:glutamine cyclotransferase
MPRFRTVGRLRFVVVSVVALLATIGAACAGDSGSSSSPGGTGANAAVQQLAVRVVTTHPHDQGAYTQGLEADGADRYIESTGRYGRSQLRRVELTTGAVVQQHVVDSDEFAEGVTRVDDRLIQLTWREGVAHVYDATTFEPIGSFAYDTEGWGLCFDGARLVMSDGTDTLFFRDPDTFEIEGEVDVSLNGDAVDRLNELECVDGSVYANVYRTDRIVQIDPASGRVVADIDASGLLTPEQAEATDVLNGIAWVPERGVFLITGKLWPTLFEVTFEPAS